MKNKINKSEFNRKVFLVRYENIEYKIDVETLTHVLKLLSGGRIKQISCKDLDILLEKYKLYDHIFLSEISIDNHHFN